MFQIPETSGQTLVKGRRFIHLWHIMPWLRRARETMFMHICALQCSVQFALLARCIHFILSLNIASSFKWYR